MKVSGSWGKLRQISTCLHAHGTNSYCYGGSASIRFGGSGKVQSVVICHPGRLTLDEVRAIKVPSSWVCAEGMFRSFECCSKEADIALYSR